MSRLIDRPRAFAGGTFIIAGSLFLLLLGWTDFEAAPDAALLVGAFGFVAGVSLALALRASRRGPTPPPVRQRWPVDYKLAVAGGVCLLAFALFLLVLGLGDFDTHPGVGMFAALLAFIGGISMASLLYWNQAAHVRHR